jgi:hypothetical protein
MLRHQINSFLISLSDDEVHHVSSDFSEIIVNVLSSFDFTLEQDTMLCDRAFTEDICRKKEELFSVFTGDLLKHFEEWRQMQRQKSNTFTFWDQFLHMNLCLI